jgi:hypothetical protein
MNDCLPLAGETGRPKGGREGVFAAAPQHKAPPSLTLPLKGEGMLRNRGSPR